MPLGITPEKRVIEQYPNEGLKVIMSSVVRCDSFGPPHITTQSNKQRVDRFMETIPKALRFQISGLIGTVLFYVLYRVIIEIGHLRPTLSWFISYFVSTWWQFELHSRLVFLNWKQIQMNYFKKLSEVYALYALSMVLSTVLHAVILTVLHFPETLSWVLTLVGTGILNYFTVSSVMEQS